ncbi:MAG: GSCFA domain-containing protein [Maribacter sp.]|nr:GSCFA domain-containing protein [Maribacter sp.]
MKLQTQVPLRTADNQIDYQSQLLLLGSCFVQNIGQKLDYHKFRSLKNPFGILFHPIAIETLVSKSIREAQFTNEDLFYHNGRWHCFDAHSDLSDVAKEDLVRKLNTGLKNTRQQIYKSTHIIITLGTAWVYRYKSSEDIVANCHKVPQKEFSKELLSVENITKSLGSMLGFIESVNPNAQIIFTVSPVRHLKDGFVENQRSKAHLIAAIHRLLDDKTNQNQSVREAYFPSYEIMMDELRDYRFYKSDMVHPNELAVDYIWERFKGVWISDKAFSTMAKVEEIQRGLKHRPFNPGSQEHQKFLNSLNTKTRLLQKEFPFIEFQSAFPHS